MALQGTMEGICVICKLFLDNIQQLSGQDHKRHKNIGPVLSFFWTNEGRIEEEKCRDIKGNFHICTSCQGNQDSGQGEAEAEIVRYPYKSEVKLIDVNDRTAFVPLAYFSEHESSMKEPDINTTIFLPSRSSDVCEENMMESITSALINTKLVQKQQYNVSNFFNTDPLVIPNVLFRAMLEKIGNAERGIRIGMNKTKTGNIVSDRTPEKKVNIKPKGIAKQATSGLMHKISSSEEYRKDMENANFARCLTLGRVKLSVSIEIFSENLYNNLTQHPGLAAALLLFNYNIPTVWRKNLSGETEYRVKCLDQETKRFCNPWVCNKNSHNHPLEELMKNILNKPFPSDWQQFPVVAQYTKKLVSHLVTQLIKRNNKYDLYLKFGKRWKVSLVGHLWPDELLTLNKRLAQEDLCVQQSRQVCVWVKKNLTVSTDPDFLKDQFNLEYERATRWLT